MKIAGIVKWRKSDIHLHPSCLRNCGWSGPVENMMEKINRTFREETRHKLANILEIEPDDLFTEF
jgi:hypothetical protein